MSGLKLPKNKYMSMNKFKSFLKPEKIYIPLMSEDIRLTVKKGDYVYKGQVLGKRTDFFNVPIISSVSGVVLDFSLVTYQNGKKVNAIVIENDYKEALDKKYEIRKKIEKMDKETYLSILEECGIIGMSGSGFPTYMKYKTDKKIKTLIINAVECEPYITADYTILMEKCEEILETIDNILDINDIDEAIIAVKQTNVELLEKLSKYLGTYLRISVKEVPDRYPMGWERTLVKEVKNVEYDKLPIDKGIIVNNVSTIYAINQALKYNKPIIERIVTFTGEGLKKPQNILVKIGTKVTDVINEFGGTKKNIVMIANGPMMGNLSDDELVVTSDLNCVLILPKRIEESTKECLRCGKCATVCPANLCPVMIKDNLKNIDNLRKLDPSKCISCGLCSYICPSKIDVREFVNKAKTKVKGGK